MQEPPRPGNLEPKGEFAFTPASAGHFGSRIEVGELLLTVDGRDGSRVAPRTPGPPGRFERRPPAPARPAPDGLLGRELEIAELTALLEGHVHVRLRGPAGVGRTALLRSLAARVAGQAPDGVVHLDGRGHDLDDLLQQLHDTCLTGPPRRWDRRTAKSPGPLRDLAALVVVDDLDLGPDDVRTLLAAVPESVFLAAGPGESPESLQARSLADGDRSPHAAPFHDMTLTGLARDVAVTLIARATGRPLDDDETAWARALAERVDGHPGKLFQVAALLRLTRRRGTKLRPGDTGFDLPALVEPQLLAGRLVAQLDDHARRVVRVGTVLGGALPGARHLPGVIGADDPARADEALVTLVGCGLVVREHGRHRLASGVAEAVGAGVRGQSSWAVAAIQHYATWLRTSATPEEAAHEAPAVLAALHEGVRLGQDTPVRALARAVAPAFAAAMRWEAWEEALRVGLAAARSAAAGTDEAWFRHELAVHALCTGDRAGAREEALAASRLRDPAHAAAARDADLRVHDLAAAEPGPPAAAGRRTGRVARPEADPGGTRPGRRVMLAGSAALVAAFAVTMAVVVAGTGEDPSRPVVPVGDTRVPAGDRPGEPDASSGQVLVTTATPEPGSGSATPAASPTSVPATRATTARPTPPRTPTGRPPVTTRPGTPSTPAGGGRTTITPSPSDSPDDPPDPGGTGTSTGTGTGVPGGALGGNRSPAEPAP